MIRINLMSNKNHFEKFCAAMDALFSCRSPHCDKCCWASALRSVQGDCNKGVGVSSAAHRWAESGLTHKDGEEILADLMKVDNLDEVRKLLKEEKA